MSILIDLFGSMLICAVLAVSVSRMNDLLLTRTHQRSAELTTEATARSVVYALEHDLRKVGYGVSGTPFSLADSTRVRFYADVDADECAAVIPSDESSDRALLQNAGTP